MIQFNISALPQELQRGLAELAADYSYEVSFDRGVAISAEKWNEKTLNASLSDGKAVIHYSKTCYFFRAFSLLLEAMQKGEESVDLTETPQFDENGAMFDVSQGNAVLSVASVKEMIRRMAMMGLNLLMLYCEDSYTVEEEPYFGYMRGRYTEEDLRECDDYAYLFGIEMIPCIQTLSHLIDVLKWPAFSDFKEDPGTLLVGSEKTYTFVEHLIEAASRPFRSNRIHIGMDEAWYLGRGRYLDEHGKVPVEQIMKEHLARVMEIVRRHGLKPLMWSDMFISPFSDTGYYYNENLKVPDWASSLVPEDISMVYWDYYHHDEAFYENYIKNHRVFGEPIFAGGIWTWIGYAPNWDLTYATTHPALEVCKKMGIRRIFATIWGDNGTECNVWANLLGLSLFAEHGFAREFDEEKFKRRFAFCCGANYDDFYELGKLDAIPGTEKGNFGQVNASKYLMWQDPLMGLYDYNSRGLELNQYYTALAARLEEAIGRNGKYDDMFRFYYLVAHVLSMKAELGLRLTEAYKNQDREALRTMADVEIPEVMARIEALRSRHKANWFAMNKAIGWDVFDMRYGSVLIRLRSAREQIEDYLEGRLERLEELEEERRSVNGSEGPVGYANFYGKIVSASRIAPEA